MIADKNSHKPDFVKKSIHFVYHLGFACALLGLILLITGVSLHFIFEIIIYDQRHSPTFHQVKIKMGLFGNTAMLVDQIGNSRKLTKPLELTDSRWHAAQLMAVFGILAIVLASFIHIATTGLCRTWRIWWIILIELCLLFIAVICILICLSLTENEIEVIHDSDDSDLNRMLYQNGLMVLKQENGEDTPLTDLVGNWGRKKVDSDAQEYNLFVSSPQHSFFLFIASEFFTLLSFLCILVFFIRISDLDEKKKRNRDG